MKRISMFVLVVFLWTMTSTSATSVEYISNCTNLNSSGIWYLTQDIIDSTAVTCMNITAENVTLDCQDHKIDGTFTLNGASGDNKYAIYSNQFNTTIRNCEITNWQTGIYLETGADNGNITNNALQYLYGFEGQNETKNPGGNAIGIYILSSENVVYNNRISSLTGGTGASHSGYYRSGVSGGNAIGIYLSSSSSNNIYSNNISSLTGGTGGDSRYGATAGEGGTAVGIYLSSSSSNNIYSNNISSLTGGTGGGGGTTTGGSGGTVTGIYLSSSSSNNIYSNNISSLTGGEGGIVGSYGPGGTGGTATGLYFTSSSTNNNIYSNTISSLTGGSKGKGYGRYGSDGAPGASAGIWLADTNSYNNVITQTTLQGSYYVPTNTNTIDGKAILFFYNKTSLDISNFDVTTDNTPILLGGSTRSGAYREGGGYRGGAGGISAGLVLIDVTNSIIENNTFANFTGQSGGSGGYCASGGSGGTVSGIYLSSSSSNNIYSNTISSLTAGQGGTGAPWDNYCGGSGGTGGTATGLYFTSSSTNNNIYSNTISSLTGGTRGSKAPAYYSAWGLLEHLQGSG